MGGCHFGKMVHVNVRKRYGGEFKLFDTKLQKSSKLYYLKPGLYPSIVDNVEAINMFIQQTRNQTENRLTVKTSRITQKNDFYIANEGSGLAFFSTDLGHNFGAMSAMSLEY